MSHDRSGAHKEEESQLQQGCVIHLRNAHGYFVTEFIPLRQVLDNYHLLV